LIFQKKFDDIPEDTEQNVDVEKKEEQNVDDEKKEEVLDYSFVSQIFGKLPPHMKKRLFSEYTQESEEHVSQIFGKLPPHMKKRLFSEYTQESE